MSSPNIFRTPGGSFRHFLILYRLPSGTKIKYKNEEVTILGFKEYLSTFAEYFIVQGVLDAVVLVLVHVHVFLEEFGHSKSPEFLGGKHVG